MANDDLINRTFGQYEIKSLLGRGGMAAVYLARQKSMDRDVAVKVMSRDLADDEQFVARFEHEAQLIARLQHPHILPVIDFGREDKLIYIVMRLVRGGSLDDRLRDGPLTLELASRMLTQVASALTFAHEQGIIHRDLKPNNVLLDERDNAYLTDFGIAKMLAGTTKLTATGNILGTPSYMAPEQWRGEPVDARTDIYSLGVVLYEMVLGQLPFSGETPYTLMYQHFNDPPPPPRQINPNLNPSVEAVILRALSKEPDARYQSADAMAEDMENAVRGLPTVGSASPALDKTVIGADEMPTMAPRPGTPMTPVQRGAATPPPTAPAPAAPPTAASAVPPQDRRGLSPLVLGIAAVVALFILGGGAYVLFGGGSGDEKETPVVLVPTDTNTPQPTDTATPQPTDTATPQPTDTPTDTPQPTDTPSTTTATVLTQIANVRRGPGSAYEVIGTLNRDQNVVVIGVSDDGAWYQVIGGGLAQVGWISGEIVRISGNMEIAVVVWPTDTPTITSTPTDIPTETPTSTPTLTATPTETTTPEVSATPPVDEALFVPAQFDSISLAEYGISLDYPANWYQPKYFETLGYTSMSPEQDLDLSRYPWIRITRGTPEQLFTADLTSNISSPAVAVENTKGMTTGAHRMVEGTRYPTYLSNTQTGTRNNWAWIIAVSDTDWIYIIAYIPLGDYEESFSAQVLPRMVNSIEIDGLALLGESAPQADPALFVPAELKPVTLDAIGVTLDYPTNWLDPTNYNSGGEYYVNVVDSGDPAHDLYPSMTIARGTPQEIFDAGMATDISSPVAALESMYGVTFSGKHTTEDSFSFPAYKLDQSSGTTRAWGWLVVIGDDDWLYMIVFAPVGTQDDAFAEQVLLPMVDSLVITVDAAGTQVAVTTPPLSSIPARLGDTLYDSFDDNHNDWSVTTISGSALSLTSANFDDFGSSNPGTVSDPGPAFYTEATGRVVDATGVYEYGLAFRVEATDRFYMYAINDSGQYYLSKYVDGGVVSLVEPTASGLIQTGIGSSNTLGVLVMGDYIEMYLNGQFLNSGVDRSVQTGSTFVTTYAYQEGSGPVTVAFDTFALLPFEFTADPGMANDRVATVASITVSQAPILAAPDSTADTLIALGTYQFFVVFGRSPDSQYLYGYSHDYTGWIAASDVSVTRADQPVALASIPAIAPGVSGFLVQDWPVAWDAVTIEVPEPTATPVSASMLSYGQQIDDSLDASSTRVWLFFGVAGDVVTVTTDSGTNPNLDTFLSLSTSDGTVIAVDDDSGPGLSAMIANATLPSSGMYTIEVLSVSGEGPYTLSLEKQ